MKVSPAGLRQIQVVYLDRNFIFWGLPYGLRPGQSPRDIDRGPFGDRFRDEWVYLGSTTFYYGQQHERELAVQFLNALERTGDQPDYPFSFSVLRRE